jgi:hypothetical protein
MRPDRSAAGRRPPSPALRRSRGSGHRRLVRTVVLGTLAVAAGIAWLAVEYGMNTDELLDFAFASLALVVGAIVLALAGGALLWGLKRLRRRR